MSLGRDYEMQDCPLARALELVGERWTLLILRDCFFGVTRFNDFLVHLDLPKGILSSRLKKLVIAGILYKRKAGARQYDYLLSERGTSLWPVIYGLCSWGDTYLAPAKGRRRLFSHVGCGCDLDRAGSCLECKAQAAPENVEIRNGPGADIELRSDPVTRAMLVPHRLLSPLMSSDDRFIGQQAKLRRKVTRGDGANR